MDFNGWQGKYVIVYGKRTETLFTLISMLNKLQKVDYVCVEDGNYDGLRMLNREVISLQEVEKIAQDSLIIVSPQDYDKLSVMFDNVWQYDDFGKEEKIDLGTIIAPIKGDFFYNISLDAKRVDKLIIYGTEETAQLLHDKLSLIDVEIDFFVDDNVEKVGELIGGKQVCSVYDLLYEDMDTLMVINTNKNLEHSTKILTEIGLEECKNFRYIQQYQWNYYRWYHWIDPNLGYNIINKGYEKYPGFFVYGEDNSEDYKIVISGGSTVDATLYPFKPWAEVLYDIIKQYGFHVTLYVAGAWGYPVETELIKFLRDILPLEPDMMIDYSGVNNLVSDNRYPFCNAYQKQFYEKASNKSGNIRPVTYGICRKEDNFTQWLSNERIMQAVCREFGIRFISILQPLLGAKRTKYSSNEKEIILNSIAINPDVDYMRRGKEFSDSVKNKTCEYHWLYDFSQIFDETEEIWIDKCHVNEKGNEIIGQRVWEVICLTLEKENVKRW